MYIFFPASFESYLEKRFFVRRFKSRFVESEKKTRKYEVEKKKGEV